MSDSLKRYHVEGGHHGLVAAVSSELIATGDTAHDGEEGLTEGEPINRLLHAAASKLARAMPERKALTPMGVLKVLDGRTGSPRPSTLDLIYAAIDAG